MGALFIKHNGAKHKFQYCVNYEANMDLEALKNNKIKVVASKTWHLNFHCLKVFLIQKVV